MPRHLQIVRSLLRRLNYHLTPEIAKSAGEPFDSVKLRAAEAALRDLPAADENAREYLAKHIPRLARTLALVPPPGKTDRKSVV